MNDFIVFTLVLVILTHTLKIIYILFRPKLLSKIDLIAKQSPGRLQLILYYLLAIIVSFYALLPRI